jgi:hypothetical protein
LSSHDSPAEEPVTERREFGSAEKTRAFLALCLNPGEGVRRTPLQLVQIMQPWLEEAVFDHAPHLREHMLTIAEQRRRMEDAEAALHAEQAEYAEALLAWIESGEAPAPATAPEPGPERCDGTHQPPAIRPEAEPDHAVEAGAVGRCDCCGRRDQPIRLTPDALLCRDSVACLAAGGGDE